MTYAFTYDVPIDAETYARIKRGLGAELPAGMIAHLVLRIDNGLRYVEVWQSEDDHKAFVDDRLHPVVHAILQEMLGFVPPEPVQTALDVVDVWTDRASLLT
jgi:heme-degrading monooxygenase HmoA